MASGYLVAAFLEAAGFIGLVIAAFTMRFGSVSPQGRVSGSDR